MERPEQLEQQRAASAERNAETEASRNLLDAAWGRPSQINIEKESSAIARELDQGQNPGKTYEQILQKGASHLSADLMPLAGKDLGKYNALLKAVSAKIEDEPASNPGLDLRDWSNTTKTWKSVAIVSGDALDAYRVVQPGNTLDQIVKETYDRYVEAANGDPGFSRKELKESIIDLNKMKDPDKLKVGQVIQMRDSFFWS